MKLAGSFNGSMTSYIKRSRKIGCQNVKTPLRV